MTLQARSGVLRGVCAESAKGHQAASSRPLRANKGEGMAQIKRAKPDDLGVTVSASPQKDQKVVIADAKAVCRIFGTNDEKQAQALLTHCAKAVHTDEATDQNPGELVFMLSVVMDLAPRDAVERMLAVQMAATHVATIRAAGWLSRSQNLPQAQTHSAAYTKLARTFAAQVEALRKHRTGGAQTVRVEHVTVEAGGQAIVGNVQHGGRGGDGS